MRLAPGWGGHALGVSPIELFRTFTDARDLTARLARLEDRLFACKSQHQAASLLTVTVGNWANEATAEPGTLNAVRMLRICGGQMRVNQAAQHLGVSPRSFRRTIKNLVGLSPKPLARIFRFRRTLDIINGGIRLSLGDVALRAGYTDQAHMTREFQMLGGFTPKSRTTLVGDSSLEEAN